MSRRCARVLLDRDCLGLRPGLATAGHDVAIPPQLGLSERASDGHVLTAATASRRALLTGNRAHFSRLHRLWADCRKQHCGILLLPVRPIAVESLARTLFQLARTYSRRELRGRLLLLEQIVEQKNRL